MDRQYTPRKAGLEWKDGTDGDEESVVLVSFILS